jgi:PAS domain S-box-containing protein
LRVSVRLRQLALVGLVLLLTIAGFFATRYLGEMDAKRDSSHRADIAATQVHDRVAQAETLVDGVRRFLAGHDTPSGTTEQLPDVGALWLNPAGLPAAAWVERVPARERASYERRTGHHIVIPTASGGLARAGSRKSYLPATLVTGFPPMSAPGLDLGGISSIAATVARPETAYRVRATSLLRLPDGTIGLFLVQSAQRLNRGSVEPGFAVLFLPASWLLSAADTLESTSTANPRLRITVSGVSAGQLRGGDTAQTTFEAAGQLFEVRVPRGGARGAAVVLPWIVVAGGVLLAALAGALGVISARRAKARAELDRLFTISPDLIVVSGFDGYFKRVNPAFHALLGYTEQEALSRPILEFVHPDDRERTSAELNRRHRGEMAISFQNRYVCKNGSYRWMEWTAVPIVEDRLNYAVARDVTERRQAETDLREAEERNRALAEEQAALRRVATLVAQGVRPAEIFSAVSDEVGRLFGSDTAAVTRFDHDDPAHVVVGLAKSFEGITVGTRWELHDPMASAEVYRTGRSARVDAVDWSAVRGPIAEAGSRLGTVSTVASPIVVEGHLWGAITVAAKEPLSLDAEGRLEKFTDLVATAIANAESREALAQLADQQDALRRLATLVAEGVEPDDLFAVVAEEVSRVVDVPAVSVVRYERDGTATECANFNRGEKLFPVGVRWSIEGTNILRLVRDSSEAARIDDYSELEGEMAAIVRRSGVRSTVGVPILVAGRVWGTMVGSTTAPEPLPEDTKTRLASFTELLATAIGNAESRAGLARLADEQAALRRVATLVAEGVRPEKVFFALSEEVSRLVDAEAAVINRLEADGRLKVLAASGSAIDQSVLGTGFEPEPGTVIAEVLRTGRATRKDDYGDAPVIARELGIRSGVAIPIVVEGALWGIVSIGTVRERFPDDTPQRLEEFTELAATAIANAESRSELAASRVRIVAASDETRRRIERDLHDGTQQRLVSLSLELRLAESTVPAGLEETRRTLDRATEELDGVIEDLREISRGIHPAILSEGGLGPALRTLARRSAIPVELDAGVAARLPQPIEVAAYYVVSEALANATKHAMATGVAVAVEAQNGSLRLTIDDDGVGGADPSDGSGLAGLRDRVEALGGSIKISSPAGEGTRLVVELPLELDLTVDEPEPGRSTGIPASA